MSTTSPQAKAAGENAAWQANLSAQLGGVAIPELQQLLGSRDTGQVGMIQQMLAGRGLNGMLPQDRAVLNEATGQLNQGYNQAGFGQQQTIGYGGLRSGEGRMSPGAMNASMGSAMTTLERQRQGALSNLNFMSAQSSMADYNKLLGLMGQGVQTSLGLAQGFSGASNAALSGMSQQTEMGGALAGAGMGASAGAVAGPYGALIGGVVGGAAGYFGSRG